MLPVYGMLAQLLQQNQALRAQAIYEADQAEKRRKTLEFKRHVISEVKQFSQELAHLSKTAPHQVYIHLKILYFDLDRFEISPDDFDELTEKEDLALLGRRLTNIESEVHSNLTADQLEICNRYLQILSDRNEARFALDQLAHLHQWQSRLVQLAEMQARVRNMRISQIAGALILLILLWVTFNLYLLKVGSETAYNHLILWILAGLVLGAPYLLWLDNKKPKNVKAVRAECQQLARNCKPEKDVYWEHVREKFGENVDSETLSARAEQLDQDLARIGTQELGFTHFTNQSGNPS